MRDADPVDAAFAANAHSTASQIERLPAREGWPRGAPSDDTALTLLVAHHLADRHVEGDPADFPADLAEKEAAIRGLGPTTTAASSASSSFGPVRACRMSKLANVSVIPMPVILTEHAVDSRLVFLVLSV